MIQLYHSMDSLVSRVWRALLGRAERPIAPAGARVLPAYAALARFNHEPAELEPRLRVLVTQLAAERSGCRWCIERGRHFWRETALSRDMLGALLRYETSRSFSAKERAALRFADAVTRYSEASGGIPAELLASARRHLTEAEIAGITAAVASEHFFDPATGTLGADTQ